MIFVTGGTGFLGSYLLKYLIEGGYEVRALRRKSSSTSMLGELNNNIEWVEGDVLDILSLKDAMKGVTDIYHNAAVVSFDPRMRKQIMKVNVEGTTNMVNLAIEYGVKRFLHVSSIGAFGRSPENRSIDEDTKWIDTKLNSDYSISKYRSENEVWRGIAEGLNAVIVNPSLILGAGDWTKGTPKFLPIISRGLPFYSTGTTGLVDVRDVARVMIKLMNSEISNERFIITSENLPYREIFNEIADNLHKNRPFIRLNKFLNGLAWRAELIRCFLMRKEAMVTRFATTVANQEFFYSNAKVKNTLVYDFIPVKTTIKETCQVFLDNGRQAAMLP